SLPLMCYRTLLSSQGLFSAAAAISLEGHLLMKPTPARPPDFEVQPPLERLREQVQGALSRLGNWGKRLLSSGQQPEAGDGRMSAARVEGSAREWKHEEPPITGASRPLRRVTAAQLSQPAHGQRPSRVESSSDAAFRRAELGSSAAKPPASSAG